MKSFILFFILPIIFFLSSIVCAEEIHLLCPEPNAVHFSINPQSKGDWDRFIANGFPKITQGDFPSFLMTIFDESDMQPTEMYGASYIYDGTFICNYFGGKLPGPKNVFPLVYGDLRPAFPGGCYFKINHEDECSGNVKDCELICKR